MADTTHRSKLSKDTTPLEPAQLSAHELQTILDIERRLFEAQEAEVQEGRQAVQGYLATVQKRHPRVLLLDGGRGTGKTSILLTLVDRWHGLANIDGYEKRIKELLPECTSDDLRIPTHAKVVGGILDFDPLPPEMPLIAGIVEAWRMLAEKYDEALGRLGDDDEGDDRLMDLWHRLFRVAAVGWSAIPRNRGLIEQVLDREEQVQDWKHLDRHWESFVNEVIKRGKTLKSSDKLDPDPVFVIMIDDVDLQVGRIRELLPALRLLYHPRVLFLVAADRRHMIDMLELDFRGQENKLAHCHLREGLFEPGSGRRWAVDLAKSAFQKVFPLRNRWLLRQLSLGELLEFPANTANLKTILNGWWEHQGSSVRPPLGDYLAQMVSASETTVELPAMMPYRTAHQVFEHVSGQNAAAPDGLAVVCHMIGASGSDDLVRIVGRGRHRSLEYLLVGELAALFRASFVEPISVLSDIVASARPDFIYRHDLAAVPVSMSAHTENTVNFMSALLAVTLREDEYGLTASGLRWEVRLALAWTRVRMFDPLYRDPHLDLAFQWRFHLHPSPKQLLQWAYDWSTFVQALHSNATARPERIVYAWIHHQLRWLGVTLDGLPNPLTAPFSLESLKALLARVPAGNEEQAERWRKQTLPLMARPELGLVRPVQDALLEYVKSDTDAALWLWDQRRRLVTDAILAAADEVGITVKDAEDQPRVDGAIESFERRHERVYGAASPWWDAVELPVSKLRAARTVSPSGDR